MNTFQWVIKFILYSMSIAMIIKSIFSKEEKIEAKVDGLMAIGYWIIARLI